MTLLFEDVAYTYAGGSRRLLIKGKLEVPPGSSVAIIGGNGTGKTTLLRVIGGLLDGFEGTVHVPPGISRAFVPADLEKMLLPWYSVAKNLGFFSTGGRSAKLKKRDQAISELTCVLGGERGQDLLDRKLYEVSTGERAAVALLASLWRKPALLLLDEIFANASFHTGERMITRLREYCHAGGTLIFTTHRPDVASTLAEKTIALE